jgi:hypothetical protein
MARCNGWGLARGALAWVAFVAAQSFTGIAHAQSESDQIRELERRLDRSLEQIDQLTRRVNELEKAAGPTGAAPAPAAAPPVPAPPVPPAQSARLDALERSVTEMAMGHEEHGALGVPLHGFADTGYEYTQRPREDNRRGGFILGNMDFFFTPNFNRVKMLAELNFEVNDEGGLDTDLERLQLGYTFSDALTVWLGRFHTPYGYWNAAFHHGAQIQTVTRPRFVDFEDKGGVLPAHSVGLWANGHLSMGGGKLVYDAYFANGSRIVDGTIDFNARRDDNANKGVGGNVGYRFGGNLEGLLVGVHGLSEEVASYDGVGGLIGRSRLAFSGAYYYLDMGSWESIAEYYRFRNRDLSGASGSHGSWAAFLQVGHTFFDLWTPYYRWEKAQLDPSDLYFASQEFGRSYSRHVLGLKYALNPNVALKIEGNRTREILGEEKSYSEARAQFAVRF